MTELGNSTLGDFARIFDSEGKVVNLKWYDLGGDRPFVAICEESGCVAKASAQRLYTFVVYDVHVIPGKWCEEAFRCLCVKCPLNKTTRETLAREYRMPISKVPKPWDKASEKLTRLFYQQNHKTKREEGKQRVDASSISVAVNGKRKPIKISQRFRILERDGFRCRYCGRGSATVELQMDHIVPVSKGGSNDDDNLLTACKDCNYGKATRLLDSRPAS